MNPNQYQHFLKKQQKILKKLLLEINKRGNKYAVFSNLFGKTYEQAELIKVYFEKIENQFKVAKIWFSRRRNAMVTINNNRILFDKNENFIIDHQKGLVISLQDYYIMIKTEYENLKETLDYVEKEFDKIKTIYPDDFEKYEIIEQYEKNQALLENIVNKNDEKYKK